MSEGQQDRRRRHRRRAPGGEQKLLPPRPTSAVHYAGAQDVDALVKFLWEMREDLARGWKAVDSGLIAGVVRDLAVRDGGVAMIVRGATGIEASLGLRFERPPLSREHYLRVLWHVVAPEARLTGHARSLLMEARGFSDRLERPLLIENFDPDAAAGFSRFVARHLDRVGVLFVHAPA